MYVPPNDNTVDLVQAARAFLANQEMHPLAFVLVVDRRGNWRSVYDPDGEEAPLGEEEGKFAETTVSWWVRETTSECVRIVVNGGALHIHYA